MACHLWGRCTAGLHALSGHPQHAHSDPAVVCVRVSVCVRVKLYVSMSMRMCLRTPQMIIRPSARQPQHLKTIQD